MKTKPNVNEPLPASGLLDALGAPETSANRFDDVSPLLTAEERLWAVMHQATLGEYRDSVPRWPE